MLSISAYVRPLLVSLLFFTFVAPAGAITKDEALLNLIIRPVPDQYLQNPDRINTDTHISPNGVRRERENLLTTAVRRAEQEINGWAEDLSQRLGVIIQINGFSRIYVFREFDLGDRHYLRPYLHIKPRFSLDLEGSTNIGIDHRFHVSIANWNANASQRLGFSGNPSLFNPLRKSPSGRYQFDMNWRISDAVRMTLPAISVALPLRESDRRGVSAYVGMLIRIRLP